MFSCAACARRRTWGPTTCKSFERIYPELAAKYGVLLYPFFLDGPAADLSLRQLDGLHPNTAGVGVIVARILPKLQELIAQSASSIRREGCALRAILACCGRCESTSAVDLKFLLLTRTLV